MKNPILIQLLTYLDARLSFLLQILFFDNYRSPKTIILMKNAIKYFLSTEIM